MSGSKSLRTVVVVVVLALAWAVGAVPAYAAQVFNSRGSNTVAQVVWGTGDENGGGHFGGIYGDIESWGVVVGLWEQDAQVITCDDGTLGYVGTIRNGDGAGSVTIAPNLRSARVSGVLTIVTMAVDYCAGNYGTEIFRETGVPVLLLLEATGQPMPSSSKSHDRLASVYNQHQNVHSMSRSATGSATLGGTPYPFDSGLISRNQWTDHSNEP